ncbi:ABC transporter ATP-binding protein [Clostridium kluyveri]|uniref:ABC transporter ATP-binding protein n=1 Tax=Clostridium kluyveri TaxID=1534 RepID=UPI002246CA5D|nr:ABC transporter ATP-binding protein [Clostridium kluyveri]UZQ50371.1 ABC transporter ATP-binding protein/permease [Clostridium kluyveri]
MKNILIKIKWIKLQINSFLWYIAAIIIGGVVLSFNGIYRALIMKKLVDSATSSQLTLLYKSLGMLALSISIDILLSSIISNGKVRCSVDISNKIQKKLYEKLMNTNWIELGKYHSGDILTRMTSDIDAITNFVVNVIPNIFSFGIQLLGSFITLLFLEPYLAICIILISPMTILLGHFFSKKLKLIYMKLQDVESRYRSCVNESLQNIIIIKTFCREIFNINKIEDIQRERQKLAVDRNNISILSSVVLQVGSWIGFIMVFVFGTFSLAKGTSTFGTLTASLQLVGSIQGPFAALSSLLPQIISAVGSTERVMEFEDLSVDSYYYIENNIKAANIICKNVHFNYKKNIPLLNNISVNINQGETVALLGSSGKGKTTFIHLLLALINPTKGHLYIKDGSNIEEINASTRKFIAYVPQGNTLFSGTIADNLRFGNLNATDDELKAAAKSVCAWDFISQLPEGLNTTIGEKGLGLSEGQAQRLAIARALLHKAPILLLDEATSALDESTELKVLNTIQSLNPSPTCIIITHRTAVLNICDKIFKIENNNLIEKTLTSF